MEATTAPALDPATRGNSYPAAASACTAPTKPMPRTPPPSHTRSARAVPLILELSSQCRYSTCVFDKLPAHTDAYRDAHGQHGRVSAPDGFRCVIAGLTEVS